MSARASRWRLRTYARCLAGDCFCFASSSASDGRRRATSTRALVPATTCGLRSSSGNGPPTSARSARFCASVNGLRSWSPAPIRIASCATATATSGSALLDKTGGGVERQVFGVRQRFEEAGGAGDHRRVVRAQVKSGDPHPPAQLVAARRDPFAQRLISGDAAAEGEALDALLGDRLARAPRQRVDDGLLVGGGQIGKPLACCRLAQVAHLVEKRGLEPAEAQVVIPRVGARELDGRSLAALGGRLDQWAAWIAETQNPRALVERLAGSVVQC